MLAEILPRRAAVTLASPRGAAGLRGLGLAWDDLDRATQREVLDVAGRSEPIGQTAWLRPRGISSLLCGQDSRLDRDSSP